MNIVDITAPTGDWLANCLRPLTFQPPSTLTAVPFGWVKSPPPVDTSTVSPPATRLRVASAPGRPRRQRHAVKAVTWWCIDMARAVEPQCLASSRSTAAISAIDAPIPPSSLGTPSVSRPAWRSAS